MQEGVLDSVTQELNYAIARYPDESIVKTYLAQGEFFSIDQFLPQEVIDQFMTEVETVRPQLNRNYVPTHKKGGQCQSLSSAPIGTIHCSVLPLSRVH